MTPYYVLKYFYQYPLEEQFRMSEMKMNSIFLFTNRQIHTHITCPLIQNTDNYLDWKVKILRWIFRSGFPECKYQTIAWPLVLFKLRGIDNVPPNFNQYFHQKLFIKFYICNSLFCVKYGYITKNNKSPLYFSQ